MTTSTILSAARSDVLALRDLVPPAPVTLAGRTLVRTGVSDGYVETASPVGPVFVAFSGSGIRAIERPDHAGAFEREYQRRFGRRIVRVGPESAPPRLLERLGRRFAGKRVRLPIDLSGLTPFEQEVLLATARIPHGEVRPYGWIAREIGRPRAVRAVGSALAHNPIPLAIPCHRVVRSDGHIGQYSMGGPEVKRAVLRAEGLEPDELERLAAAGIRYVGSDTTRVFCLPSCRDARRIGERHRVTFGSAATGHAAGYRPCLDCRPVALAA